MGRRRGNHHLNLEDLIWEERYPPNDRHNDTYRGIQLPRAPKGHFENPYSQFERGQYSRSEPWNNSHSINPSRSNTLQTSQPVNQAFLAKSKRLKEYLVRSLSLALNQIEQWYPEESADQMDWQHEEEIVVEQRQEPSYVWSLRPHGVGESSPTVEGDEIPRRSCFSEGLRAAGFDGGDTPWIPKADRKKVHFENETTLHP